MNPFAALWRALFGRPPAPLKPRVLPDLWFCPAPAAADLASIATSADLRGLVWQWYQMQTLSKLPSGELQIVGPNTVFELAQANALKPTEWVAVEAVVIASGNPSDLPIMRERGANMIETLHERGVEPAAFALDMSALWDQHLTWSADDVSNAVLAWIEAVDQPAIEGCAIGLIWPWDLPVTALQQAGSLLRAHVEFVHLVVDWFVAARDEKRYTALLRDYVSAVRSLGLKVGVINWCHVDDGEAKALKELRDQFAWFQRAFGADWPDRIIVQSWGSNTRRDLPSTAGLLGHVTWIRQQWV